jgi:hypothetical protein
MHAVTTIRWEKIYNFIKKMYAKANGKNWMKMGGKY